MKFIKEIFSINKYILPIYIYPAASKFYIIWMIRIQIQNKYELHTLIRTNPESDKNND